MRRFTRIKGVTDLRRLPRLGKIRLGVKAQTASKQEYPKEVEYFVVPPEVAKVYGEQPKEIDVLFPVDDPDVVFPQAYEYYGAGAGLKCSGDGETAMRGNEQGDLDEVSCPCDLLEKKKCQRKGHLMVILPKISYGGVYQIDVGSFWSITEINSYIDWVRALVGKVAMVPLKLKRVPMEMTYEGTKRTHYVLKLVFEGGMDEVRRLHAVVSPSQFALPEPPVMEPFEAPPGLATVGGEVVDLQTGEVLGDQPEPPVEGPLGVPVPDDTDAETVADMLRTIETAKTAEEIDGAVDFAEKYPDLVGGRLGEIKAAAQKRKAALAPLVQPAPSNAATATASKHEKMLLDAKTPESLRAAWAFIIKAKDIQAADKGRLQGVYDAQRQKVAKAA